MSEPWMVKRVTGLRLRLTARDEVEADESDNDEEPFFDTQSAHSSQGRVVEKDRARMVGAHYDSLRRRQRHKIRAAQAMDFMGKYTFQLQPCRSVPCNHMAYRTYNNGNDRVDALALCNVRHPILQLLWSCRGGQEVLWPCFPKHL